MKAYLLFVQLQLTFMCRWHCTVTYLQISLLMQTSGLLDRSVARHIAKHSRVKSLAAIQHRLCSKVVVTLTRPQCWHQLPSCLQAWALYRISIPPEPAVQVPSCTDWINGIQCHAHCKVCSNIRIAY